MTSALRELETYIDANARKDPFRVREGIWAMHEVLSRNPAVSPDTLDQIARSGKALNGVCSLTVDMMWSEALRTTKWWRRRKFAETKDEWKEAKHKELLAIAVAEVGRMTSRG